MSAKVLSDSAQSTVSEILGPIHALELLIPN